MTGPELHYLRLFPLGSAVLFPGMELPLVIFEERYRLLIQECQDEEAPFGVVLLQSGREVGNSLAEPYEVGTTAHLTSVETTPDERLRVLAVGRHRFRVHTLDHARPYLAAQVEYLADEEREPAPEELVQRVRDAAAAYVKALASLRGGWLSEVPLPQAPAELAYLVAQVFQGRQMAQQRLLEATTTSGRLEQEATLLESARQRVQELIERKWSQGKLN